MTLRLSDLHQRRHGQFEPPPTNTNPPPVRARQPLTHAHPAMASSSAPLPLFTSSPIRPSSLPLYPSISPIVKAKASWPRRGVTDNQYIADTDLRSFAAPEVGVSDRDHSYPPFSSHRQVAEGLANQMLSLTLLMLTRICLRLAGSGFPERLVRPTLDAVRTIAASQLGVLGHASWTGLSPEQGDGTAAPDCAPYIPRQELSEGTRA